MKLEQHSSLHFLVHITPKQQPPLDSRKLCLCRTITGSVNTCASLDVKSN